MKTFPCWIVDVRHERNSGVLGHFTSRPVSWTEAKSIARYHESTGTPVSLRCIDELTKLHLEIIHGEIDHEKAVKLGRKLGYDIR